MAARKNPKHADEIRQKIQAAHLIRRLQQHIKGKIKMSPTQVRAADLLLKKIVPDLVQTNVTAEHTHRYVVEAPPLLTRDEWQKKYRVTRQQEPPTLELKAEPRLITTTKQ